MNGKELYVIYWRDNVLDWDRAKEVPIGAKKEVEFWADHQDVAGSFYLATLYQKQGRLVVKGPKQ